MNRKILYIIFTALAVLLLVALLWWWFLQRESTSVQTTGTFGTAQNASSTGQLGASQNGQTNVGTVLPGQNTTAGSDANIDLGNVEGIPGSDGISIPAGGASSTPIIIQPQGQIGTPGVIWLSGTPGTSVSTTGSVTTGPGTVFNPTGINPIVDSNPSGGLLPNIGDTNFGQDDNSSVLSSLGIAAGVGVVTCAIVPAIQLAMRGKGEATGRATAVLTQAPGAAASAGTAALSVSTIDIGSNLRLSAGFGTLSGAIGQTTGVQSGQQIVDQFMGCMARNIAKIMLQQITASVVNWINSGFNGSPAFVQNPSLFLQQTADQIAGNYVKSSALSFLCSPFQLQIRIAIAQSYANRNANSCTLTQVTGNMTNFMHGAFSTAGGWPAFLSFTSTPTNNPYGAFLYGTIGLQAAVGAAQTQVQTDLLQGSGFLSFQKIDPASCKTQSAASADPGMRSTPIQGPGGEQYFTVCKWVTTTPGRVISDALGSVEKSSLDQIGLAKSFDEIISALINQLMTRTLQNGLSSLSGTNGYASNFYTTDQLQSQEQGQGLVSQMQQDTNLAVAYANVQQGSIEDIQSVQNQINDTYNCWSGVASSSPSSSQAISSAAQASTTIASLNVTVDGYNNRISLANAAIVALQQLQSRALSAASADDIAGIQSDYDTAKASGQLVTQNDVTNAQQNRTTLQSQMAVLSQQTLASLAQCNAVQ
ncbi:MAG TPA: hypothetical protein VG984_03465 [Candidatus Paceibacterota bacterium]|nr:hypothetical protein [Candidatus Paceibacterota bacterium]